MQCNASIHSKATAYGAKVKSNSSKERHLHWARCVDGRDMAAEASLADCASVDHQRVCQHGWVGKKIYQCPPPAGKSCSYLLNYSSRK